MTRSRISFRLLPVALLMLAVGCADAVDSPDAGFAPDASIPDVMTGPVDAAVNPDAEVPMDGGPADTGVVEPGLKLKALHLAPAPGRAASPEYNLRGGLRPSSSVPAISPAHRLRGGLVPGGTQAVTP